MTRVYITILNITRLSFDKLLPLGFRTEYPFLWVLVVCGCFDPQNQNAQRKWILSGAKVCTFGKSTCTVRSRRG